MCWVAARQGQCFIVVVTKTLCFTSSHEALTANEELHAVPHLPRVLQDCRVESVNITPTHLLHSSQWNIQDSNTVILTTTSIHYYTPNMVMSIKKTTYITSLPPWQPSQQPADKSASRLLQLPDEIKVLILEQLLISPEGVNGDKHPSILGTCQDMLNIGQPILYSQTERVLFFCYGGAGVLSFLQGPHRPITYRPSYFEASYNLDQRDMLRDITAGPLDEIILSHLSKFTHIRLQVKTSDSVGWLGHMIKLHFTSSSIGAEKHYLAST